MKKLSFEGFGAQYLTFKKAEGADIKKGDFVSVIENATVTDASEGEIVGVCADVCGELVTVQVSGYIKAKYASGQNITLGRCHLGINSEGEIMLLSNAQSVIVTDINTAANEVGFIL